MQMGTTFFTVQALKECLVESFDELRNEHIKNLYGSVPRRLAAVLENQEKKTKYCVYVATS